jgi:hypothetical protein
MKSAQQEGGQEEALEERQAFLSPVGFTHFVAIKACRDHAAA